MKSMQSDIFSKCPAQCHSTVVCRISDTACKWPSRITTRSNCCYFPVCQTKILKSPITILRWGFKSRCMCERSPVSHAVYTLIQCTPLLVEKAGVAPDVTFGITTCKQERVQVRDPLWIWNPWGRTHEVQNRSNQSVAPQNWPWSNKKMFLKKSHLSRLHWRLLPLFVGLIVQYWSLLGFPTCYQKISSKVKASGLSIHHFLLLRTNGSLKQKRKDNLQHPIYQSRARYFTRAKFSR